MEAVSSRNLRLLLYLCPLGREGACTCETDPKPLLETMNWEIWPSKPLHIRWRSPLLLPSWQITVCHYLSLRIPHFLHYIANSHQLSLTSTHGLETIRKMPLTNKPPNKVSMTVFSSRRMKVTPHAHLYTPTLRTPMGSRPFPIYSPQPSSEDKP